MTVCCSANSLPGWVYLQVVNLILKLIGGDFIEELDETIDDLVRGAAHGQNDTAMRLYMFKISQRQFFKIIAVMRQ